MSQSIIRTIIREATRAFRAGSFTFTAFGRVFGIEHVNGWEYRLLSADGKDAGMRIFNDPHGFLRFSMQ